MSLLGPEAQSKPILVILGSHEAGKRAFLAAVSAKHWGEFIEELFDRAPMVVCPAFTLVSIRPGTVACAVYAPIARAALVFEYASGRGLPATVVACAVRRGPDLLHHDRSTTSEFAACNLANPRDVDIALCGLLKFGGMCEKK